MEEDVGALIGLIVGVIRFLEVGEQLCDVAGVLGGNPSQYLCPLRYRQIAVRAVIGDAHPVRAAGFIDLLPFANKRFRDRKHLQDRGIGFAPERQLHRVPR